MQYLESFSLPTAREEEAFVLSFPYLLEMQCYSGESVYPFKIFPQKEFFRIDFAPITIFYGGNGSGKSTLLNVIAEKLGISHSSPFNDTPFMEEYLKRCSYELTYGKCVPKESRIITSDDVFDFLLDIRYINEGIAERREALFHEYEVYQKTKDRSVFQMRTLDDYDELKRQNELRHVTKSKFTANRLPHREISGKSNGESAYLYFTKKIEENALYLLDEPENSLSAKLQNDLRQFIEDSVRFFHCQFVLSTHSPFLLSMKGAKIYDLDAVPVSQKRWTELENVRVYRDFFEIYRSDFEN